MQTTNTQYLPVIAILSAALLWALIGPFSSMAMKQGISVHEIAFWRALLGGILFMTHAVIQDKNTLFAFCYTHHARECIYLIIKMLLFGTYGVAIYYSSYQLAVAHAGIGVAAVLLYTAPVWVLLADHFIVGRGHWSKLQRGKLVAVVSCLMGVIAVSSKALGLVGIAQLGIASGLIAGACYATYYFLPILTDSSIPVRFVYGVGMIAGACYIRPFIEVADKTPVSWCALAAIGVLSTYCAYSLLTYALQHLPRSTVAVLSTFEPIFAFLLGSLFFGDSVSSLQLLGCVAIVIAAFMSISFRDTCKRL